MAESNNSKEISDWRSIITLIVFVITNIVVLFPFHIPIYVPKRISNASRDFLASIRVVSRRKKKSNCSQVDHKPHKFPINFVTAPLIADLFLLAIKAIGRKEVHDGTIGANNISPIDIMFFFLTLAYIAISIDASGLIRWLAFKVLQWGGDVGHKLFFYLYAFFFTLGSFIGNDPIILSGTAFLAYMTRVSKNINHPRAWIFSQFAVANIASAILVSSNPTNLVLAGAFEIKFIHYTANMIVPVVITAVLLFPFLLYILFSDTSLIPESIEMETLSDEDRNKEPVNPNIPYARGPNSRDDQNENLTNEQRRELLPLEEIMNPFLDKGGAAFGAVIMAVTLVTLLALNAASTKSGEHPVFWVTLPAAFVMFCWDVAFGWYHRKETRELARKGRREAKQAKEEMERARREEVATITQPDDAETEQRHDVVAGLQSEPTGKAQPPPMIHVSNTGTDIPLKDLDKEKDSSPTVKHSPELNGSERLPETQPRSTREAPDSKLTEEEKEKVDAVIRAMAHEMTGSSSASSSPIFTTQSAPDRTEPEKLHDPETATTPQDDEEHKTLVSLIKTGYEWLQDTFPTAAAVIAHLPFALVPFAFAMFVLVQALVTKGWVQTFAKGWDHWVNKTGTPGSIGGMGFLSVVLCNFAGTNIGTTILLSRVIQEWETLRNGDISDRTFWGTVYSMALGVNYGAFSSAFSASLAGLLWRDILQRKHIHVKSLEFARTNFPIIAIAMTVGCTALIAEVYIMRDESPYKS